MTDKSTGEAGLTGGASPKPPPRTTRYNWEGGDLPIWPDAPKPPWAYDTSSFYASRSRTRARVVYKEPPTRLALLRQACAPHVFRLCVLALPFVFGLGLLAGAWLAAGSN